MTAAEQGARHETPFVLAAVDAWKADPDPGGINLAAYAAEVLPALAAERDRLARQVQGLTEVRDQLQQFRAEEREALEQARDQLAEQLRRVRAMHSSETIRGVDEKCAAYDCDHDEDACPERDVQVCAHCREQAETFDRYGLERVSVTSLIKWPCATVRALDGEE